jgi:hypothetical protein
LCEQVDVNPEELPLLWDVDFLLGDKQMGGPETYVLCEINVSSVAPFPEAAIAALVDATRHAIGAKHR